MVESMSVWSPRRIGAFLVAWSVILPLQTQVAFPGRSLSFVVYAALWGYFPGGTPPYIEGPLVIGVFYTAFMIPYYAPGLAVAWFAWRGAMDSSLTRGRFIQTVIAIQLVHILVVWFLLPCPISLTPHLCIPSPTTGIVALAFTSKVVKEIDEPWAEHGGSN
ncbi:MAG: hypothetical protein ACE5IO_03780 [Thermoplasmata archaeon]